MKILVFTTLYPNPEEPAKGTFIRDRVVHVARRDDCEVEVVAPVPYFPGWIRSPRLARWAKFARVPAREERDGLTVWHPRYFVTPKVGMRSYGRWLALGAVRVLDQIRERFDFDVMDCHYLYPDAWAGVRLARRFGVPVVVSARGTDTHTYASLPGIRGKLVDVLNRADRAIAVSEDLRRRLLDLSPDCDPRVIPNGVDSDRFAGLDRASARARLEVGEEERIVLCVGRLTPVKGHATLLRAFATLVADDVPERPRLVLAGGGELRGALEDEARSLGLDSSCMTFLGEQSQETLALWYSAADIFCLPSRKEGWPNVLMESLACGTPVVASRVGGAPEIVSDDDLGMLVPPDDAASLAAALREALARPWDRERIRDHVRHRSWDATAAQVAQVLHEIHESPVSP